MAKNDFQYADGILIPCNVAYVALESWQQHTESMVGNIIWVLLENYLAFQQWKDFENPLRIDKVIAMSLVYYFFGTPYIPWVGRVLKF